MIGYLINSSVSGCQECQCIRSARIPGVRSDQRGNQTRRKRERFGLAAQGARHGRRSADVGAADEWQGFVEEGVSGGVEDVLGTMASTEAGGTPKGVINE